MGLSHLLVRAAPIARQRGMGLVELMISITLGLLIVSGVASMFIGTARSNIDLLVGVNLEHELHTISDMMLRDLRRAGGHGRPELLATGAANPFTLGTPSAYGAETANSCIEFSYDLDQDGVLDTGAGDERFGFRLRDQAVQVRRSGVACAIGGNWETMTDSARIRITALNFAVSQATANAMRVRSVRVTLTGQSAADADITRTITREVRVRNDAYSP